MKIPEGLDEYINDYEMKVFEIAWLTEEEISRFHSDFKVVANFFVQKRKHKDYIPDDPTEIRHIDEVLKLLRVMTGDERYQAIFQKREECIVCVMWRNSTGKSSDQWICGECLYQDKRNRDDGKLYQAVMSFWRIFRCGNQNQYGNGSNTAAQEGETWLMKK